MYATTGGLTVYAEAKGSSRVVGHLGANEKVLRGKQKDGFAFIRARGGKLEGWVPAARLRAKPLASAPAAPAASRATTGEAEPADANAAPAETASEPVAPETAVDAAASAVEPAGDAAASAAEPAAPEGALRPAAPAPEAAQPPATPAKKKKVGAAVFDPY
jgi:hypothetical protein